MEVLCFRRERKDLYMARVIVTKESESGRNQNFLDIQIGVQMTRKQFVAAIKQGLYDEYYVRQINNILTPCSKPDDSKTNNLG